MADAEAFSERPIKEEEDRVLLEHKRPGAREAETDRKVLSWTRPIVNSY